MAISKSNITQSQCPLASCPGAGQHRVFYVLDISKCGLRFMNKPDGETTEICAP